MTLQLLPSEFPYIWGYFLYQGRGIGFSLEKLMFKLESALTKNQGNILNPFINDRNLLGSESPHLFLVNIRIGRIFQRTFPAVGRGLRVSDNITKPGSSELGRFKCFLCRWWTFVTLQRLLYNGDEWGYKYCTKQRSVILSKVSKQVWPYSKAELNRFVKVVP